MSLGCHDYCLDSMLLPFLAHSGDIRSTYPTQYSVDNSVYRFIYADLKPINLLHD
ncbi:hypothetical protein GU253_11560 [Vibrio cholerae]|nr:hypothetical protein [Vibrio paracholerae]